MHVISFAEIRHRHRSSRFIKMGNVSSHPTGPGHHCADCMPGSFPEDLPPGAAPPPPQQGVKRQRHEHSQEDDGAVSGGRPALKKYRILQHPTEAIDSNDEDDEDDQNDSAQLSPGRHLSTLVAPFSFEQALRKKFSRAASVGPVTTIRTHDLRVEAKDAVSLEHGYETLRKLGARSAEGVVYLKKSKRTAELLAVKVLKEKARSRDVTDVPIECLLHLNLGWHPHIVFLTQIDIVGDGIVQLGMEFSNGGDLMDYLERRQRYSLSAFNHKLFVVHIVAQLGEALAFLHHGLRRIAKGAWVTDPGWESVTHSLILGDLKPANIVLNFSPTIEFGILPDVKIVDTGHMSLSSRPLRMSGTPPFCPEVRAAATGVEGPPMSTASDVWTFGATVYYMITGNKWTSCRDTRFLTLPTEYEKLEFTRLLRMCLQTNPKCRPTFDCHFGHGIISVIDHAWDIRTDLMYKTKTSERDWWIDWRKEVEKDLKA